jgi:hypothetical protein
MIKKIAVSFCLLFSLVTLAQESTSSPYSFYGIGDIKFKGTVENRAMGGVNVFPDSTHVNLQNPASYSGLRLTNFTVGGTFNVTKFSSNTGNDKSQRTSIDYLALGIPMGKFGAVVGLLPYSAVGYKIQNITATGNSYRYNGSGGVNKLFIGLGYTINKNFNVGADFAVNFGSITTTGLVFRPDVQFGSRESNDSDLRGTNVNIGLMYKGKFNEKLSAFGGLVFSPEGTLKSKNTRNIATVIYSETESNNTEVDRIDVPVADTEIKLPSKVALSFGFGEVRKWLVGTEFAIQQSGSSTNRFKDITKATYENATKFAVGGYYIPKYDSFTSYFDRVTYRGGFRYENTGLVINNESINDMAVTLGFGLPVGGRFSNINLGMEFGRRGTKAAGLIQENYGNFSVSLTLNDQWFIKRKID